MLTLTSHQASWINSKLLLGIKEASLIKKTKTGMTIYGHRPTHMTSMTLIGHAPTSLKACFPQQLVNTRCKSNMSSCLHSALTIHSLEQHHIQTVWVIEQF